MHLRLNTLNIPKRREEGFQAWGYSKASSDYLKAKSNSFGEPSNGNNQIFSLEFFIEMSCRW